MKKIPVDMNKIKEPARRIKAALRRVFLSSARRVRDKKIKEKAIRILSALKAGGPLILWGHSLGSGVAAQLASEKLGGGMTAFGKHPLQ